MRCYWLDLHLDLGVLGISVPDERSWSHRSVMYDLRTWLRCYKLSSHSCWDVGNWCWCILYLCAHALHYLADTMTNICWVIACKWIHDSFCWPSAHPSLCFLCIFVNKISQNSVLLPSIEILRLDMTKSIDNLSMYWRYDGVMYSPKNKWQYIWYFVSYDWRILQKYPSL